MAKALSTEARYYLAIWRKAWIDRDKPETLIINTSSLSMAISMRQGMYRAIRPYRSGSSFDQELANAADQFVVYLAKGPDATAPHKLELRQRLSLTELERELLRLGLEGDDLLLTEEKMAAESLSTFLPDDTAPVRSNPFYTRED